MHELGVRRRRLRDGGRVAVNCAAGLNRSGLIVGRALIELGRTPAEAIGMVRAARGPWGAVERRLHAVPALRVPRDQVADTSRGRNSPIGGSQLRVGEVVEGRLALVHEHEPRAFTLGCAASDAAGWTARDVPIARKRSHALECANASCSTAGSSC